METFKPSHIIISTLMNLLVNTYGNAGSLRSEVNHIGQWFLNLLCWAPCWFLRKFSRPPLSKKTFVFRIIHFTHFICSCFNLGQLEGVRFCVLGGMGARGAPLLHADRTWREQKRERELKITPSNIIIRYSFSTAFNQSVVLPFSCWTYSALNNMLHSHPPQPLI